MHLAMRRWMLRYLLTHTSALRGLLASALPSERLGALLHRSSRRLGVALLLRSAAFALLLRS